MCVGPVGKEVHPVSPAWIVAARWGWDERMGCYGVGQEVTAGAGWVLGGGGRRKLERGWSCGAMKVERGEVPEGRERWASGALCRPWRGRGGLPRHEVQARGRGDAGARDPAPAGGMAARFDQARLDPSPERCRRRRWRGLEPRRLGG